MLEDLSRLHSRVETLQIGVQTDSEIEQQMRPFLEVQSCCDLNYINAAQCV